MPAGRPQRKAPFHEDDIFFLLIPVNLIVMPLVGFGWKSYAGVCLFRIVINVVQKNG